MPTNLINTGSRVLAAIDASVYATSVADHAAWAASRLSAPLQLVHAIERSAQASSGDLSGSLSLGSQEQLLAELAAIDERRGKLLNERGRHLLERAQAHISNISGMPAEICQRHGSIEETLLDLEAGVRLYVLGKRGEHADFSQGHLGSSLERIARSLHRPILVASRAFRPVARFLIAYDGSVTTRKCGEMVSASPLLKGLDCDVLLVGEPDADTRNHLEWAEGQLQAAGFTPVLHVMAGIPDIVIARQASERATDLLVMGAYGHSRIRTMVVGSTTTQVLRACQIPVLLLR